MRVLVEHEKPMMTDISESFSENDGCYYGVFFGPCLCCCSRMKLDSRAGVLVMRSLGKMPAYAWKLVRVCCAALNSMHNAWFVQRGLHCMP